MARDGLSAHLAAVYIVISPDPAQTFTAHIEGASDLQTGNAVLDGRVVDGWLKRAHVHVEFKTINCTQAPNGKCFQGTISVTRSSGTPGTNATSRASNSAGRPRKRRRPAVVQVGLAAEVGEDVEPATRAAGTSAGGRPTQTVSAWRSSQ